MRASCDSQDYEDCREYATCKSEGFHCYKRATTPYAQCRPEIGTQCVEAGLWDPTRHSATDWLCPGWEYCAARHGNCAYSRCCQNANDACLTRHENYAQCLPAYTNMSSLETSAGDADRVSLAEQTACAQLKTVGWECQKLLPETSTCSHDCARAALSHMAWPRCTCSQLTTVCVCVVGVDAQGGCAPLRAAARLRTLRASARIRRSHGASPSAQTPGPTGACARREGRPSLLRPAVSTYVPRVCDARSMRRAHMWHEACGTLSRPRATHLILHDPTRARAVARCALHMHVRDLLHSPVPILWATSKWDCTLHDKTKKALPPPPPTPSPPPPGAAPKTFTRPYPPPPAPAFCAANRHECFQSRCCQSDGFTCYAKGEHHAECLPTGQCRERWPDAAEATCDELHEVTECATFGGDCTHSGCCSVGGQHCFMKDPFFSRCMHACVPTGDLIGWSCVVHEKDDKSQPAAFCTAPYAPPLNADGTSSRGECMRFGVCPRPRTLPIPTRTRITSTV